MLKNIIFSIINIIPTRLVNFIIKLLLWSKSEKLQSVDSLRFLFGIDKELYGLEGRNASRYDNGLHAKHRLINYHKFFIDNIPEGSRVLDFGCGNGALASDIADNVNNILITGIDIESKNVEKAKTDFPRNNIEYIVGDGTKDLPNKEFDVIILSNVLEHIEHRIVLLTKLKKLYNPKLFLIRVPMIDRDWRVPLMKEVGIDYRLDDTHFIEFTIEDFENEIEESGLKILSYKINWGEIWAVISLKSEL